MKRYTWTQYLRELLPFAWPFKRNILVVVLFTLIYVCLDLLEPIIYKNVVNDLSGVFVHKTISEGTDISKEELHRKTLQKHTPHHVEPRTSDQALKSLLIAVVMLFLINTVSYFFYLVADFFSAKYSSKIEQNFMCRLFRHVLNFDLKFFSKTTTASVSKKIDQTDQVGTAITSILENVSTEVFQLVGAAGIMFYHHANLALAALVTMPFYFAVSIRMAKRLEGDSETYLDKWDDVSTKLQDNLNHIKTVKASGAEDLVLSRFVNSLNMALKQYLIRSRQQDFYEFFQNLCINIGRMIVLVFGSYSVWKHQMSPGEVVMFVTLLDQMYDPINGLTSTFVNLQIEKVSVTRGLTLLHKRGESNVGEKIVIDDPEIKLKDINFSYVQGKKILKDVSLTIIPFKYNVLVGPSGSGKTTVLDLILDFIKPESGEILIAGKNINLFHAPSIRSQIGLVAADGAVFRGTLKDNILFKNPAASDEEIKLIITKTGLERVVERLPEGIMTEIGDSGIGLSLGERQRLQFARVLISYPKILLLDEATSNLDYATEQELLKNIMELRNSVTVVVVAHRYSMIRPADNVIVLENGRVTAEGTINDVEVKNEWFRKMASRAAKD